MNEAPDIREQEDCPGGESCHWSCDQHRGTEISTDTAIHWGCQLLTEDGQVYTTRWDPGHGSGTYLPYTEAQARADVADDERGWPAARKRLVTRTETTTVVTTPWVVVEEAESRG
jgi:hypothetical protein